MNNRLKTVLLTFLLIASAIILASCNSFSAWNKGEVVIDNLTINAIIADSGILDVQETWEVTANASTPKRNLYKTISLVSPEFSNVMVNLIDFSVVDNLGNILPPLGEGKYDNFLNFDQGSYIDRTNLDEIEIGLIMPEFASGTRTYTFNYKLDGMILKFNDCEVVYWQQLSTDFALYISNFELNIALPDALDERNVKFWLHSENRNAKSEIIEKELRFKGTDISPGNYFETRFLFFETEIFPILSYTLEENRKTKIESEETKWAEEWESMLKKQRFTTIFSYIFMALLVFSSIVIVLLIQLNYRKKTKEFPQYHREILEGITPAETGHFFYYYKGGVEKSQFKSRIISATILDLIRKRYVEIAMLNEKEYRLNVVSVTVSQRAQLKPHEATVYDLLNSVKASVNEDSFSMHDFEKYSRQSSIKVSNEMRQFMAQSAQTINNGEYQEQKFYKLSMASKIGPFMALAGLVLLFAQLGVFWPIFFGMLLSGIALTLGIPKKAKLNEKGEDILGTLEGLYNFMKDFSNLKEHEIPQLILWEEYMVYATMMGISKEVLKVLNLKIKEMSEDTRLIKTGSLNSGSFLFTYMALSRFNGFDLGNSISTSVNNVSTFVRSAEISRAQKSGFGGGGGGFGGGGGGFGGGGGGAR